MVKIMNKDISIDSNYNVFSKVFGKEMKKDKFFHKHYENPARLSSPIREYKEDGKTVGMNAFMRIIVCEGRNMKKHYVSQSNDTAVLPEYRGRHIFTKIIMEEERENTESDYIFGIPNDNSYPGFIKMGWKQVASFTHYIIFLRPFHLLIGHNIFSNNMDHFYGKVVLRKKKKQLEEIEIETGNSLELSIEDWEEVNKKFDVGIVRSQKYMEWKLKDNSYKPKCIIFKKDNKLIGYIIWHKLEKLRGLLGQVDDFYQKDGYNIWPAAIKCLTSEVDMIDNPLVNIHSKDRDEMIAAGMVDYRRINHKYSLQRLLVSPRGINERYISRLQMRNIDFDVYLN